MRYALPAALGALLIVGAGCSGSGTARTGANVETGVNVGVAGADVDLNAGGSVSVTSPKTIKVTAKKWSFEPAEIKVKDGDSVKLEINSTDVDHGIALPAFNVNSVLKAGTTTTLEFVADKKGSFPFFCSVFCGSGHGGMRGTLIVE